MEFNEKLQELRKRKGLTQDELAQKLFVSRTAISKWESGRGYPNIDSLKSVAAFFEVTLDELLSGDELLSIAENDAQQRERNFRDLIFGLLDISAILLLFLPFFRQETEGVVSAVSLMSLSCFATYLKVIYYAVVTGVVAVGILLLALQNCSCKFWVRFKSMLSLSLNAVGVILFVISPQPYAAALLFTILAIKAILLMKK